MARMANKFTESKGNIFQKTRKGNSMLYMGFWGPDGLRTSCCVSHGVGRGEIKSLNSIYDGISVIRKMKTECSFDHVI